MKHLTDRQKQLLWQQQRSRNFSASQRLEGIASQPLDLTPEHAIARIDTLRRHYER